MNEQIKSCPFCLDHNCETEKSSSRWIVACSNCGASGPRELTELEAIEKWNSTE